MNWDAIGAVGQGLGSIAVFITLGYLAVQVRHANYTLQRSISQDRATSIRSLFMARATDERLAAIITKADEALGAEPNRFVATVIQRAGLTHEEAWRIYFEQAAWLNYRAQVFPYVDQLPSSDRALFDGGIRRSYGRGVQGLFYETDAKNMAHPEFVRYVDGLLAQPS